MLNTRLLANLDQIAQRIGDLPVDLKAETVVAALIAGGLDTRMFLAAFEGQLQRNWSDDIGAVSAETLETGDKVLLLRLNRDGIYDMLPELLFHDKLDKDCGSAAEMARDSMQLRKEEKQSRAFFQPFENAIFSEGVYLALREQQLFSAIFSNGIMGLLPGFWNIPEGLPAGYTAGLVKLIPFASRIAGNLTLTAECLSYLLKEEVSADSLPCRYPDPQNPRLRNSATLGGALLGVDTVCGEAVNGYIARLRFTIGPLRNPQTDQLLKNGTLDRFLDCFYGFFVPVELDPETRVIFEPSAGLFVVSAGDDRKDSFLGYNSVIM